MSNEAFLYGQSAQALFESLTASLGAVLLLKREDSGEIYCDDTIQVPDFRVVMGNRCQTLIEVKDFYQSSGKERFELKEEYVAGLASYSSLMGCAAMIAIYWVRWNIWTLVPLSALSYIENRRVITLGDAIMANQMVLLGDKSIGTRFPLRIIVRADKTKPRSLSEAGGVSFVIGDVEMYCEEVQVIDPVEKEIAFQLCLFGEWEQQDPMLVGDATNIEGVQFSWLPQDPEEAAKQGFAVAGSLSSMFSKWYRWRVVGDKGDLQHVKVASEQEFGKLVPDGYKGKDLPLWILILEPSGPSSQ